MQGRIQDFKLGGAQLKKMCLKNRLILSFKFFFANINNVTVNYILTFVQNIAGADPGGGGGRPQRRPP
jgi:hypothetical protein